METERLVVACIGCTQIVGDSIGPLVGDMLIRENISAFVYGTTSRPITSRNLADYASFMSTYHSNDFIIAVDACLGSAANIGSVHCVKHAITPGKAVNPDAQPFGDFGILAVVAENKSQPVKQLQSASIELIERLAKKIVTIVLSLAEKYRIAV